MPPEVSIIVTTFKRDHYLRKCMESILMQTYTNFELLVIVDGFQESTRALVENFNDQRIKLIESKHTGIPSINRNLGLTSAKNNLVCFCDDDDLWVPNKLSQQVDVWRKTKSDIIYTDIYFIKSDGTFNRGQNVSLFTSFFNQILTSMASGLIYKNNAGLSTIFFDRTNFLNFRFDESQILKGTEDYHFLINLLLSKASFFYLNEKLVGYRIHTGNISQDKVAANTRSILVLKKFFKKLETFSILKFHFFIAILLYKFKGVILKSSLRKT